MTARRPAGTQTRPGDAGKFAGEHSESPRAAHRNEVVLVGRLAAAAVTRSLPSGDVLITWRLIIDRPVRPARRGATVDAIECASARAGVRRRSDAWKAGDLLEVSGALRRRFWRGPAGPASRCEVEVERARRVATGPAGLAPG